MNTPNGFVGSIHESPKHFRGQIFSSDFLFETQTENQSVILVGKVQVL